MTIFNPYAVLGIPRDASEEDVQHAYRRLAKRYHPDLHPDVQSSQQMRRVNQAWEVLSNAASRARYDATSATPRSWASPPAARTYPGPAARPYDDAGPGWLAGAGIVAVGMLFFVALFSGFLPIPLLGIVVLVAARSIFARLG